MKIEKLSNLCDIVIGRTPARKEGIYWGHGNKWVSISDLNSKMISETKEEITDYGVKKVRCRKIPKGTLLFSFKLTIGKMAFAGCDLYTNEAIAALIIKDNGILNSEYLFFALQVANFVGSNQAVMGKTLNSKSLAEIKIPLRPLDDQIRIADLLNKVERLIALRKENLRQLDELLKSFFLEMFGDLSNYAQKSLDSIKASAKGSFSNGPFGSDLLTSELNETGGIPVIYIRDIRNGYFKWNSKVFVTKEKAQSLSNCRVKIGDLLIAKVGDPPGIAAINTDFSEAIITQDVIRLRVDKSKANPHFIQSLLNSDYGKWLIKKITIKGTRSRFSLKEFKGLRIPLPDIKLQDKYTSVVENVENLKTRYQQNLTELENFYGALSQKAFKGELDLSSVPLRAIANLPDAGQLQSEQKKFIEPITSSAGVEDDQTRIEPVSFDNASLRSFLKNSKNDEISTSSLWDELHNSNHIVPPTNFDNFKQVLTEILEEGKLLEQVYVEVEESSSWNLKKKKIALRLRDDS